jgi:hypothetical protein
VKLRWAVRTILTTALWFYAASGRAQTGAVPLSAALEVSPGATCLESERLQDHILGWLGVSKVAQGISIRVQGSPLFARVVSFRIVQGTSTLAERSFEPAPRLCADLHAAVGLAIAMALKASLLESFRALQRAAAPAPAWELGFDAIGGMGVTPGLDAGLVLRVSRALSSSLSARLSGLGAVGPYGTFPHERGGFTAWLATGRLDLCALLFEAGASRFSACVGAVGGALYAAGRAFEPSRDQTVAYLALANALEISLALDAHWSLSLGVNVLVPWLRTTFVVRDPEGHVINAHDIAAAGALFSLGPGYRF